ncbi:MAG: N-acetylneuraminate synthase [Chloroflexi bacterium]|nr:N-acetylneuraminate synthase [Chloroflexota bacterium]
MPIHVTTQRRKPQRRTRTNRSTGVPPVRPLEPADGQDARRTGALLFFNVAGRPVGEGQPCFIIAEAGVNHNGDVNLAMKLIDAAVEAGADAVKFQTFQAEEIVTASAGKAPYQKQTTREDEAQLDMLKRLELRPGDFKRLSAYARKRGIVFLSTAFDAGSVDLLCALGVPAFKIPSGEITNLPLLKHIAASGKPVILSTGMSTLDEIGEAIQVLRSQGTKNIVLLHCVSCYPAKLEDANLGVIETLRRTFGLPAGLSDHTVGIYAPIAAAALGACVIEKHFTLDKTFPGPDHRASLDPGELKEMVKAVRGVERAVGDGIKRLSREEKENRKAVRRSIVARVDIPAGTAITREMLDIKRPGTGLAPRYLDSVVGRRAKKKIESGEIITRAGIG